MTVADADHGISVPPDVVVADLWHAISAEDEVRVDVVTDTLLLDRRISYTRTADGVHVVWRSCPALRAGAPFEPALVDAPLPVKLQYGYVWTCVGDPPPELFAMPEFDDPVRRNMNAGSVVVATSAPRAVENFLDLGHFPFVHPGTLGVLPHTEVAEYGVEMRDGEIIATECDFYVPLAAPAMEGPAMTRYTYRVPHPFCVMLYYESPDDPTRQDIVALFVQPMTQELVRAHNYMGVVDHTSSDNVIKAYQLLIFSEDKPILENQHPKRLPLDPRAETPIRADKSAIAYRRWLRELGLTYGVIPAP